MAATSENIILTLFLSPEDSSYIFDSISILVDLFFGRILIFDILASKFANTLLAFIIYAAPPQLPQD